MTRKDALDILNVRRFDEDFSDKSKYDAVGVRFKELYTRNREENGGSPYLQQIIKNAFEYLRNESN